MADYTPADLPKMDMGVEPLLGRFRIIREIGRGGMGRVLEARDNELKRTVAIKLIQPLGAPLTPEALARFAAEAQITGQLNHPNIVPVHEIGRTGDGALFFVMRLVRGRSLAEIIDEMFGKTPDEVEEWTRPRLLNAFVQACNGVAYAHNRGVLHRDLKPANIMFGRFGEVLVMDWGVARIQGRNPTDSKTSGTYSTALMLTQDGNTVGTPGYMSPEQARGEQVDPRSDVWSLGAILYELLTWCPAYTGADSDEVIDASLAGLPPHPQVRAPHHVIDAEIADVALRALSPRPSRRFRNAAHLGEVVRGFLEGSQRRDRARLSVTAGQSAWTRWRSLVAERTAVRTRVEDLERLLAPWESLRRKSELLKARERLIELDVERGTTFGTLVRESEQALAQDPRSEPARQLLVRAYLERFEEAEEEGDLRQALFFKERVRAYDDGRHQAELRGTGSLTLRTQPSGAEVSCERLSQQRLRWRAEESSSLGRTPLLWTEMEMGSYVLTVTAPERPPMRYPVHITRRRSWDSGDAAVIVPAAAEIGLGYVHVPVGPFQVGGDAEADSSLPRAIRTLPGFVIGKFPVTREEYRDFLAALPPADAAARAPRDVFGDRPAAADARLPVTGVSWFDAVAYCAWRAAEDGLPWELPLEVWWEKAARGVDGRVFPWGDRFDPTLAKMRDSRPGAPRLEPVGAFADDESVYGVRDMAGSVREWCGDAVFLADPGRRPIRGGSWVDVARQCRCANRRGAEPEDVFVSVGFRLARRI